MRNEESLRWFMEEIGFAFFVEDKDSGTWITVSDDWSRQMPLPAEMFTCTSLKSVWWCKMLGVEGRLVRAQAMFAFFAQSTY